MAFTQGEKITASKLNTENSTKNSSYSCSDDWGKTSVNTPWFYLHQTSGRIMYLRTTGTAYWWAEGDAIVYFRDAGGNVTEHRLWYEADTTSRTIERTINMETFGHGPGWYSGRVWVNRGSGTINVYWGQTNCQTGQLLSYWDNPTSSGNRLTGTLLTTATLNSGRAGTF